MEVRVYVSAHVIDHLKRIVRRAFFTDCTKCFLGHYRKTLPPSSCRPTKLPSVQYRRLNREAANEASSQVAVDRQRTKHHGQQNKVSEFQRYFHHFFKAKEAVILGPKQRDWDIEWALSDTKVREKKLGWEELCEPVQAYLAAQAEEDKKSKAVYFMDIAGDSRFEAKPGEWAPRLQFPNADEGEVVSEGEATRVDTPKTKMSDVKVVAVSADQLAPNSKRMSPAVNSKPGDIAAKSKGKGKQYGMSVSKPRETGLTKELAATGLKRVVKLVDVGVLADDSDSEPME